MRTSDIEKKADEDSGLIFAILLDGAGSAKRMDWPKQQEWQDDENPIWLHLDVADPNVANWLHEESGLTEPTIDALTAENTRPRVFRDKRGLCATLRGINTNDNAAPEDMVSLRMWTDGKRLITLRLRKIMAPQDVLTQLMDSQDGPQTTSDLFERLIDRLTQRMSDTITSFDDRLDRIEVALDIAEASNYRTELTQLRQEVVILRRYIAPQREALRNIVSDAPMWLSEMNKAHLRDTGEQLQRYVEELDATRDRALVLKDDISNQLAEATNRNLYVLSIISAIFLPLGFITGLLGINVGGMPGVENPNAFWIASGVMAVLLVAELAVLRKLKWI